jgi:tRNA 2-selenouridine synthase
MSLHRLNAEAALHRLHEFDTVIDARSESEYALDHLPGAVNWPTLNDAERAQVGTEYKQVSPFDARKRGAALAARNIAAHIERELPQRPRSWRPLVYCWRGGQRSGSLATVLDAIGFHVHVVEGGYRAFRQAMLPELDTLPQALHFVVLCGRTGSAKSRLLQALHTAGAQVLDLEALACHRGSVLGPMPGQPQPSQKAFERLVWQALRALNPARPVYVESESRTIGRLRVPEALLLRMRAAPCVHLQMPLAARVRFLLHDYAHFVDDPEALCQRLQALRELRGAETVQRWQALARSGEPAPLARMVQELLEQHYDPVYLKSMQRNFSGFACAQDLPLADGEPATLATAAAALAAAPPPPLPTAPTALPEVKVAAEPDA